MKRNINFYILIILILNISIFAADSVKSTANNENLPDNSLNIISDAKQTNLKESKPALISESVVKTQNYNDLEKNFDFSKYKNITLKKVILETLALSNNLKAANEKLIQSKIAYSEAKNGYLPTINFALDTKVEKRYAVMQPDLGTRQTKTIHDQRYKVTVDQPLYSGGTTGLKMKTLKAKYKEANNKYQIILNQTIQSAIKAYFALLFDIKKVDLTNQNMIKLSKILEISQIKYDSGAISVGDLAAIKAGVANAQTQLNSTKSKLADSMDYYLYLLNNKFENTKPYEKNFSIKIASFEELKQNILSNNLLLMNYRININSRKYKLKSFKNKLKPKIDLQMKMSHILNQEDYIDDEQIYTAKLSFRYNIYNKNKDMHAITNVYSSIEELQYRYQEEIKKISWDTSKLFNSIKSLSKSLKSTQDEIKASTEMVGVYWEGFQLGEQDLQILLQGQRQLNTAKINLLKFKKDYLTNMFKVLNQTNELASFFGINYEDSNFIDFADVEDQNKIVDMNSSINSQLANLKTTTDSYLELIQEYTFDDIVDFKDEFLESNNSKYTIVISDFKNTYEAYNYIKLNRLISDSFTYDYYIKNGELQKDSLNKKIKVATKISHGIYKTKEDAQNEIIDNLNTSSEQFTIAKLKDVKHDYLSYVEGLSTYIKPYVIKPIIPKKFKTNKSFKNKFLSTNKEYFTINIVSLSSMEKAKNLLLNNNIYNDSFVFKYGRNGKWVKVVYGVFESYSQAFEALQNKQSLIEQYHPVIEKIDNKQKLYNKFAQYNKEKIYVTHTVKATKYDVTRAKKIITKKIKVIKKIKPSKNIKKEILISKEIKLENIPSKITYKDNNEKFKNEFLNADPQIYYTTNMALFLSANNAKRFVENNKIKDKTFTILFKKNNKIYYKVMYGLFKNKKEAKKAIQNLPKNLAINKPTIEGVGRKQILYKTGSIKLSANAYKSNK